ncbi:unnamed protein product [Oikopleura dioica]|uniref:Translation initiation factor eIF2B subunit delta n=1 Tax=Oikopleura dioica TaxID=34765 RepID=E4XZP2_OIKDI|nr:unnamed protein product [Oikopleura dioica]CBY39795.1 unnamed protein product [Oikopleura dioica]
MTKELSAKEKKKLEKAARRAKVVGDKGVDGEAIKAEAMRKKEESMKKHQEVQIRQPSPVPKAGSPVPQVAAILKEEAAGGRTRKISESQGVARALKSTKTQSMQVELTEPLFTYMRNTAGIKDTIQTMGFGRKDMFSRGITKNQTQLHRAIVRLGFKAAHLSKIDEREMAQKLRRALELFIDDFDGRNFNDECIPQHHRLSIQQNFISELNPNINFISKCHPMTRSEACLVDVIKEAARSRQARDKNLAEFKEFLHEELQLFWKMRVEEAEATIANETFNLITDNSTVLTFGDGMNMVRIFEKAKRLGRKFEVIVVDTEPGFSGKRILRCLTEVGIQAKYSTVAGLSYMMKQTDVVIIGARSLLANGSVVGAKGCGTVACVANEDQVPVLVCCETYKFEDRCAINALDIKNEIREFPINEHITFQNIVQDVIPASLVTAAITEVGIIASTSAATVISENERKRKDITFETT